MSIVIELLQSLLYSLLDILPIACIMFGFQWLILQKNIPNIVSVMVGFLYVIIGLALFQKGLEMALFPFGEIMASQLTDPVFISGSTDYNIEGFTWTDYVWVYIFAGMIGFATTIAEPSLLAVAIKANQVSNGTIGIWGLRITVAIGVAVGISLGTYRIVTGIPLQYFIVVGYMIVIIQTFFAPKLIIALAYDSGGVTTSTVTVPLVTALGLELANNVPGRSALLDGFGLIAFASLFPIISVMAYAQLIEYLKNKQQEPTE
jgi:hypothetical protein